MNPETPQNQQIAVQSDNSGENSIDSLFDYDQRTINQGKTHIFQSKKVGVSKPSKFIFDRKAGTFHGVFIQKIPYVFGLTLFKTIAQTIGKAGLIQGLLILLICSLIGIISAVSFSAIATNGKLKSGGIYRITKYAFGRPFAAAFTLISAFTASNAVILYIDSLGSYLIKEGYLENFLPNLEDNKIYVWNFAILCAVTIFSFFLEIRYVGVTISTIWTYLVAIILHVSIILFMIGVLTRGKTTKFCKSNEGFIVNSNFLENSLEICQGNITIKTDENFESITDTWAFSPIYSSNKDNILGSSYNSAKYLSKKTEQGKTIYTYHSSKQQTNESFIFYISVFFFAITSVFTLANSTSLKNSQESIPRGLLSSLSYVAIICNYI